MNTALPASPASSKSIHLVPRKHSRHVSQRTKEIRAEILLCAASAAVVIWAIVMVGYIIKAI